MVKTSFIIVTYNSGNYIERLLESITRFNKGQNYEVIIVDNNSGDDTVKLIQKSKVKSQNYNSKLKILENKENLGFSRGINIGVKEAEGDYLLFINPDMEWTRGSVDNFISIFENDTRVGVIGGKILAKNGKAEKSAGRFLKIYEVFLTTLSLDEALGVRFSPKRQQEVDFVSGGYMAVRRDIFERLGGFDENLFMYVEDMEFCYRVKKEGLKVLFDPSVKVIHESHGSSSRSFAIRNIYKGILYFHKKHGNGASYLLVRSLLAGKAGLLARLGKMLNNKSLAKTYEEAFHLGAG